MSHGPLHYILIFGAQLTHCRDTHLLQTAALAEQQRIEGELVAIDAPTDVVQEQRERVLRSSLHLQDRIAVVLSEQRPPIPDVESHAAEQESEVESLRAKIELQRAELDAAERASLQANVDCMMARQTKRKGGAVSEMRAGSAFHFGVIKRAADVEAQSDWNMAYTLYHNAILIGGVTGELSPGEERQLLRAAVRAERMRMTHSTKDSPVPKANQVARVLKGGRLSKLGGRSKDAWETRMFQLTVEGLSWGEESGDVVGKVELTDMVRVELLEHEQDFLLVTRVKGNKTYRLRAPNSAEQHEWVKMIAVCIQVARPENGETPAFGLSNSHMLGHAETARIRQQSRDEHEMRVRAEAVVRTEGATLEALQSSLDNAKADIARTKSSTGLTQQDTKSTRYIAMRKCLVRAEFDMRSEKVGMLEPGTIVSSFETRTTTAAVPRVRCEHGWLSVFSSTGTVLCWAPYKDIESSSRKWS